MTPPSFTSISIDLDPLEAYAFFLGRENEVDPALSDAAYADGIGRFMDLMSGEGVRGTCFAVGQDAQRPVRRKALERLAAAGFEIGNHSYSHHHALGTDRMADDMERADKELTGITGRRLAGYRSPAYWLDDEVYRRIRALGYAYDSSVFPSLLNPALKCWTAALSSRRVPARVRFCAYGRLANTFCPKGPYAPHPRDYWTKDSGPFLEIPLTVLPILNWPFQFSYLLRTPAPLIRLMYRTLLRRRFINFSFHLLDFLDVRDCAWLGFFDAGRIPLPAKLSRAKEVIALLQEGRSVLTLERYAERARRSADPGAAA